MPRKLVDISMHLENEVVSDPGFPVKIRGASAGWTRAVAILD